MNSGMVAIWVALAYLVGSIPTSFLVARVVAGVDLREHGSKNLGATNLYRLLGWKAAVPVGLFDVAKGAVPTLLAREAAALPFLIGLAAIAGHVFSPFVGFRGGKGVATATGVLLALMPAAVLIGAVVWASVVFATGYVSLGSISAAAACVAAVPLLYPGHAPYLVATGAVFALIVFTHRANIRRLLAGTESRFRRRNAGAT
jgi:glycerol-3-phosphate acyltransferase PlsY